MNKLLIGWSKVDITPEKPVCLRGQFYARVSEGVRDPITATVLVLESFKEINCISDYVIWISCDLVAIPSEFKENVIKETKKILPEIESEKIIINATHTHTGPENGYDKTFGSFGIAYKTIKEKFGVELFCLEQQDYIKFATKKIAECVKKAWKNKKEGGISYGLGFAVVGRNRRVSYYDGTSKMYGKTNDPNFSHIEGYEDHSLNVMATFDKEKNLTGLIVNVACPSQVNEGEFVISADFWHETREELKKRFGENIFTLAQCSSAGDQSPHILIGKNAEERMWNLKGKNQREEIAERIANGVDEIMPYIKKDIKYEVEFRYLYKKIGIKRYIVSEEELNECLKESEKYYKEYERLKKELEENPEKKKEPRWYTTITTNYTKYKWYSGVKEKYEMQKIQPKVEIDIHVLRLGDIVFITNPFELYLDYGLRIKARSKAVQTFVVQLTGPGTYLTTERAMKGKSYGSIAPSCVVGPEGGRELVEESIRCINEVFK